MSLQLLNNKGEVDIKVLTPPQTVNNAFISNTAVPDGESSVLVTTASSAIISDGYHFTPKAIKPIIDSLAQENSGRTEDGMMHIYWTRPKMRKFEITLKPSSAADISKVLSLVQGKQYYMVVYDMLLDQEIIVHCYTSNAAGSIYSGVLYGGLWQDVKFSAIEV